MGNLKTFEDFEQSRVDAILDKIADKGYDSLSKDEKNYLAKISGQNIKEEPKEEIPQKPIKIKTGRLIDHFGQDEMDWLQSKIDNPGVYDMPTMDEVIEYLKSTPDNESSEEVMDDLIIQYLEDEGLMFDFC
jgi:hypothetical protein